MKYLPTLILLLAFVFGSCERTTMVSGRITNARTSQPLAGLKVTMFASNGHEPRDSPNPKIVGEVSTLTDSAGGYALEYTDVGIDGVSLRLGQGYFCAEYFDVEKSQIPAANECQEVNMTVSDIDGRLRVVLQNLTGMTEELFMRVDCDGIGPKGIFCCEHDFKNVLALGETDTIDFPVSADRFVPVYWGTSKFNDWNSPTVDSVFCPIGTSTHLVISF